MQDDSSGIKRQFHEGFSKPPCVEATLRPIEEVVGTVYLEPPLPMSGTTGRTRIFDAKVKSHCLPAIGLLAALTALAVPMEVGRAGQLVDLTPSPTLSVQPATPIIESKPELERPTVWGEPTEVQIAIYVVDVDEVNTADQSFAASVYYEAHWKNPLLSHQGPGPIHRGITEVWTPRLTIVGQQAAWRAFPESVEIQPDGTVILRQKVWGRFSQPLELQDFPFDQQVLSIHIVAVGLLQEHVKMTPLVSESGRTSGIATKFSLPDFDVVSSNAAPTPYIPMPGDSGVAGYEMKIRITRKVSYFILKVIIPLCLIVIMSWLPRWIDPEQSGTNIGISTSAFLTLVAYLFAITVLLPRVSYVTRMDRFILLSTFTVFAGLIQTVANTRLLKGGLAPWAKRLDCLSRIVYPLLLAAILVFSFVL